MCNTIKKCRICKVSDANSSGYCSPCRRDKYRGKPCTSCGASKAGSSAQCKKCQKKAALRIPFCRTCWNPSKSIECASCVRQRQKSRCCICRKNSCDLTMKNNRLCVDCFIVANQRKIEARRKHRICNSCKTPVESGLVCNECGTYWHNHGQKPCIDCGILISAVATRCDDCARTLDMSRKSVDLIKQLARNYGATVEAIMDIRPTSRCQVCSREIDTVCIDHCHKTGQLRGGLCTNCNTALGNFCDNKQRIASAIDYLSMPRSRLTSEKTYREKSFCGCGEAKPIRAKMCRLCLMLTPSMKYCSSCFVTLDGQRKRKTHFCNICSLRNVRKTWYNLSENDAVRLEAVSMCEICKSNSGLCIDHCHATGAVRGVICNQCNLGLGQAKDSASVLRSLIIYLEKHEARLKHETCLSDASES